MVASDEPDFETSTRCDPVVVRSAVTVAFVLHVAVMIASVVLHFIPLMWMLTTLIHLAVSLGVFLAWLMAIIKASKGEWYKLPIIGDFAEKQARS